MIYENNTVKDLKIAYIGGGSRGWAWNLMKDLAGADDLFGEVTLYDIDYEAAKHNEEIGNNRVPAKNFTYSAKKTIGEALTGANFVVVSILPGTFDEMESDVHAPEKYGVWQSVGDTAGPGGLIRAMRTIPMFQEIALAIKEYCPNAWVINYTNPMAICVKALYKAFPEIKAFGCCHEVFGTQKLLSAALKEIKGIEGATKDDIRVEVTGVNHFTWLTKAQYKNIDLFPVYAEFAKKHYDEGFSENGTGNWLNDFFACGHKVKFDLFQKYGVMAAAGDRHLAEFMPPHAYLKNPEQVKNDWLFGLTPVSWRKGALVDRLQKSEDYRSGKKEFTLDITGEEGVRQMRAILGLCPFVTNVNLPNNGQIPNLPLGSVVETNAVFESDNVTPVFAGNVPESIYPLIVTANKENDEIVDACFERSLEKCYKAFAANHALVNLSDKEKKALFDEMVENTKAYLGEYR
jgi:alpha-galactosidase